MIYFSIDRFNWLNNENQPITNPYYPKSCKHIFYKKIISVELMLKARVLNNVFIYKYIKALNL